MAMILTGIDNKNEYYTNHYFSSIFEENAGDTISAWRNTAKEAETATPWAKFRDTSRQYYRVRDRYLHQKVEEQSRPLIQEMAELYLDALGYEKRNNVVVEVAGKYSVPIFHEEVRSSGAPLLWVVLSVANERDEDILQSSIFVASNEDELSDAVMTEKNDDILSKLFFAGEEAPRWILLIGINQIALIDRNKWNEKRYLQFDLDEIFSRHEESTFQALSVLLHKDSLCPSDGVPILDKLDENSHKHSSGVSDSLKYALRECIELLGNEVIYDMKHRQEIELDTNPVDATELTVECLRYMYRVLFMLFIEARPELGYAPMKSQSYVQGYSLEGLRDVCERVREVSEEISEGYYIDDTISELFRLVYEGYPRDLNAYKKAIEMKSMHDAFTIEALKAHIFDPEYTKLITAARLRNSTMLKIIDLMSISRPNGTKVRRGRISYSALGINQMGAVYEALLSYRGFIAEETLFEVKRAKDSFNELDVGYFVPERELENYKEDERVRYEKGDKKGQLRKYEKGTFIYRLAGREREKSASYYTPEVLTKCLVKYALKELLQGKSADEILHLTICEPAMGSAAFLNEAINQLAEAYINKKQKELNDTIPFDKRFEELQKVKMYIADNNVYGVDLNPIAVELAEVSLWLNTIYKGAFIPWFGTQLVCGNSLIGARRQVYYTSKLVKGKWYEEAPDRIMPKDTRKRKGISSRVYHFLLGDPGMANYSDKVIKGLEPENIKGINNWRKKFTEKWEEEDVKTLLRLSDIIDELWTQTVILREQIEKATSDHLIIYGYEEADESIHRTIREKDSIYKRMFKSEQMNNAGPYVRLKAAMDYWCALWFWPIDKAELLPSRQEFLFDMGLMLEGGIQSVTTSGLGQIELFMDENGHTVIGTKGTQIELELQATYAGLGLVKLDQLRKKNERLQIVNRIAEQQRFIHWELEFADIFSSKGGFDLVLGNPPWIRNEWKLEDLLSEFDPRLDFQKNFSVSIDILLADEKIKNVVLSNYVCIAGVQNFSSSNYKLLYKQPGNLYKLFAVNSWWWMNECACAGFIHPEGLYDNPYGENLRKMLYPKMRYHFEFINEKYLFKDVAHTKRFSINILSNVESQSFITITNLFDPITIEQCFDNNSNNKLMGLKDYNGEWNLVGHSERIIYVDYDTIKLFGKIFDDKESLGARMPEFHASSFLQVYKALEKNSLKIKNLKGFYCNQFYNETKAKKEQLIYESEQFPESSSEMVYLGPNFWLANPYFKSARSICIEKGDYDNVYLKEIEKHPSYLIRTKYKSKLSLRKEAPDLADGNNYGDVYKIFARRRLNLSMERSLISAIVPKKALHVHSVLGIYVSKLEDLLTIAACLNSVVFDFYIKTYGKEDLYENTLGNLPVPQGKLLPYLWNRIISLNALGNEFIELKTKIKNLLPPEDNWAKFDYRLDNSALNNIDASKNYVCNDFEKRELFVEIDVLVAMALGISLNNLCNIYELQFPVLKQYENDTWYDIKGQIVFTNNRNMSCYGLSRAEWEECINGEEQLVVKDIDNLANPSGCETQIFQYTAPYEKYDRIKDYKEVWHNFEERFKDK